jgi:hypothetical protein
MGHAYPQQNRQVKDGGLALSLLSPSLTTLALSPSQAPLDVSLETRLLRMQLGTNCVGGLLGPLPPSTRWSRSKPLRVLPVLLPYPQSERLLCAHHSWRVRGMEGCTVQVPHLQGLDASSDEVRNHAYTSPLLWVLRQEAWSGPCFLQVLNDGQLSRGSSEEGEYLGLLAQSQQTPPPSPHPPQLESCRAFFGPCPAKLDSPRAQLSQLPK